MAEFVMIWIGGNKFMVGNALADALKFEREHANANWQEEHAERVRLEERLKAEQAKVVWLKAEAAND